jgi:hypothetical protein
VTAGLALDPVVQVALQAAAALLFLAAAAHKLRDPSSFREALHGYGVLPPALEAKAGAALAAAELCLGAGCLLPATAAAACIGGALLLGLYSGAMARNLARGRRFIDCGCGGPGGRRPLGGGLLLRNAALIALLAIAALPSVGRALVWLDGIAVVMLLALLSLLYAAADVALANAARLRSLGGAPWSTH